MNEDEQFVKSIYPLAFIDVNARGADRICSELTMNGMWVGKVCDPDNKWRSAAEFLRETMLRKLEW